MYKIIQTQAFDASSAFLKRVLAFNTSTIGHAESQQQKADVKELQHHAAGLRASTLVEQEADSWPKIRLRTVHSVIETLVMFHASRNIHAHFNRQVNRERWAYKSPVYKASS